MAANYCDRCHMWRPCIHDGWETRRRAVNDLDPTPLGYDGYGAPIYPNQEDTMPTDLPPGFTGTGKPKDENKLAAELETAAAMEAQAAKGSSDDMPLPVTIVVTLVALAILGAVGMAAVWVAFWFATHLPGVS